MSKSKILSNSFSTGGGGPHFEAHVQASFVALMLTGGHAPCLPCWPITEIKLQGKINGFDTDDLVVFVENPSNQERRKLLGQIKHSVAITKNNVLFREVVQAAWNDFNNPKVFTKDKDIIALITGPLSAIDTRNVPWLLNQAKHTNDVDEFFRRVKQAKFGPFERTKKLDAIQHHLKAANGGNEVTRDELYNFLKQFRLLGYDLDNEFSVVLSLLHSHISQFQQQRSQWAWARICQFVQECNQNAGIITPGQLPEDLLEAFKQKTVVEMPEEFKAAQESPTTDWAQHSDATYLALAVLIGAWDEKSQRDRDTIAQFFSISYDEWLKKAREILHSLDSPLSLKNGIWKVVNRAELLHLLGSRILDHDLDTFKSLAISALNERDPAFDLPAEERYTASIQGKVLEGSRFLRKGIAEGLAILGNLPDTCSNCSQGKVETTCLLVLREILSDADWILWGSLESLLPDLAEAAPGEFLDAVEKTLRLTPCPLDELFAQEGDGITGSNYLTGLLWALESLAWDEEYLIRVCVVLGELASHDPGGHWDNRPSKSLVTILLPWLPQTLASVDKRKVAVQTLLDEWPDIAWPLIIQLLPGQYQTSSGSHKPNWRKIIPDNWKESITQGEYRQQASSYAELAVKAADHDIERLSELIDHFDNLPQPAFEQLIEVLASQPVSTLPEEQRLTIWERLAKFTNKHRRFSYTNWALPEDLILRLEPVAEQLAPTDPFNLYQHLFTDDDFDLYEENDDWEEQRKKLDARREKAISEIFQKNGVEGVIRFAEAVTSARQVGYALGVIADDIIEKAILPEFLDVSDNRRKAFASGFISRRYYDKDWDWCDNIDKSGWTSKQIGQFLACLPFTKKAWGGASKWLQAHEGEYWTRTGANAYQAGSDLTVAIEKLVEYGRPHAAISCLDRMRRAEQVINVEQCVRALMAALSSTESTSFMRGHHIVELIKLLQADSSVIQDDLSNVEWAYLPILDGHKGAAPHLLESRLANVPEFFCEIIQLIYRSKKEDQPPKEPTEESKAIATNAWQLLRKWKTPPGTQKDGTFSEERFTEWLQRVKLLCTDSGHLEVALINIGEVLIHAPADPDGLWIHRTVASALNDRTDDELRKGFITGTYNSRGVHEVDPSGKPEKKLAEQFRNKAEEIENAGFQRFAVTLRSLADSYDQDAERTIAEHKREDE
ncbi:MAG: hypothetical protein OXI88_08130 [Gammaproteobacteria bacterium]|nr:hypothetical protein [Gammaproteobacteria bacterium]